MSKITKLVILIMLGLFARSNAEIDARQETPSLRIEVKDARSGDPLEGAKVHVSSSDGLFEDQSVTAKDGKVRFSEVPAGKVKIVVILTGWKDSRTEAAWNAHDDKTISISLERQPEADDSPNENKGAKQGKKGNRGTGEKPAPPESPR